MEAVLALVITLVIAVLPALLFLGLWHGLDYLRDDDLLERAREERDSGSRTSYKPRFLSQDAEASLPRKSSSSPGSHCPNCGAKNRPSMDYCKECLSEI